MGRSGVFAMGVAADGEVEPVVGERTADALEILAIRQVDPGVQRLHRGCLVVASVRDGVADGVDVEGVPGGFL